MKAHSIMFHHFHDGNEHVAGQGSITELQFDDVINYIKKSRKILSASEWLSKAIAGRLADNEVCLSFDDNLKCQYDIALPVLEKHQLTAFWFIYSSPLEGILEKVEIYRFFRSSCFDNFDSFFNSFLDCINRSEYREEVSLCLADFEPASYLSQFSFYTENDRKFRYLRDHVLKPEGYNRIMGLMMTERGIDPFDYKERLWMTREQITRLHKQGHIIGLHSHTHPMAMASLEPAMQRHEYQKNIDILTSILGQSPIVMSHPCNSYNETTLGVLQELNVQVGFRSNMADHFHSQYEFPREDHINIIKEMGN